MATKAKNTSELLDNSIELGVKEIVKKNNGDLDNLQKEVETLRTQVASGDLRAISTLNELVNLIVVTYNEGMRFMEGTDTFISQFIDNPTSNDGNGRRYIKHFATRPLDFDDVKDKFIPTQFSAETFKVEYLKFKNDNGTLAAGSVQKVWNIVYRSADLITYFINGQLSEFLQEQIFAKLEVSRKAWTYDYVMKALTDVAGKGKEVVSLEENTFDAITKGLLPEIALMKQNSPDYNVDKTLVEAIDASRKEDLVMLISPRVKAQLNSNIISQLFNSQKVELMEYVGQIHEVNRKFNFDQANETVRVDADAYVDDKTIIVIDKSSYWKCINMLKFSGEQAYPLNMGNLQVLHEWFAQKHLPWGKLLVFKCDKLLVSPK